MSKKIMVNVDEVEVDILNDKLDVVTKKLHDALGVVDVVSSRLEDIIENSDDDLNEHQLPTELQTDQMKVEFLQEHWEKITLEQLESLVK